MVVLCKGRSLINHGGGVRESSPGCHRIGRAGVIEGEGGEGR